MKICVTVVVTVTLAKGSSPDRTRTAAKCCAGGPLSSSLSGATSRLAARSKQRPPSHWQRCAKNKRAMQGLSRNVRSASNGFHSQGTHPLLARSCLSWNSDDGCSIAGSKRFPPEIFSSPFSSIRPLITSVAQRTTQTEHFVTHGCLQRQVANDPESFFEDS